MRSRSGEIGGGSVQESSFCVRLAEVACDKLVVEAQRGNQSEGGRPRNGIIDFLSVLGTSERHATRSSESEHKRPDIA